MTSYWQYDDGGRADAGFQGKTGDCVTRAVAIATGRPYREVYDLVNELAQSERPRKNRNGNAKRSSARTGTSKATTRAVLKRVGWEWTPTMTIGSGCNVHLTPEELPPGRLVARLSKHLCAVIDGVVHDTHDPTRDGTRCVYGYWMPPEAEEEEIEEEEPRREEEPYNCFRDGRVHVCREMCSTCVFRPGNLMRLERGRLAEMVKSAEADQSSIICHSTLYEEGVDNAVCRGFYDRHPTQPLQVAQRLGIIEFDDPQPCPRGDR